MKQTNNFCSFCNQKPSKKNKCPKCGYTLDDNENEIKVKKESIRCEGNG